MSKYRGRPTGTLYERWVRRVSPEPNTGCWLWTGGVNVWGYGMISLGGKADGSSSAHRVSYMLHKGDPRDLLVLHSCDNRLCVNPEHLFLGTQRDNIRDMINKGRRYDQRGEKGPSARLTVGDILDIRSKRLPAAKFAQIYGVSPQNICDIQKRRTWEHV